MPHLAGGLALHLGAGDVGHRLVDPLAGSRVPRVLEQHRHRVDGRDGIDDVLAGVFGRAAPHRLEHAHAAPIGIEVGPRGHAHASLQNAAEVGDDVAEHVGGDDHVVGIGVLHHPHAAGIDVVVVGLHVGVVLGHLLERPPPEVMAKRQHVGLGDERERLLRAVALPRVFEGPADAPLAALAGVDGLLHGHLVGRALLEIAAHAAVKVFGVFADDHEVDVLRATAGQRRLHARQQFHGPQVDVLVELEPQVEEQSLLEDAGSDIGMADRSEKDRVFRAQQVEPALGDDLAGLQVAIAAPVERLHLVGEVFQLRDRGQDLHRLGGDLGAGAVSGDCCDLERLRGHGWWAPWCRGMNGGRNLADGRGEWNRPA